MSPWAATGKRSPHPSSSLHSRTPRLKDSHVVTASLFLAVLCLFVVILRLILIVMSLVGLFCVYCWLSCISFRSFFTKSSCLCSLCVFFCLILIISCPFLVIVCLFCQLFVVTLHTCHFLASFSIVLQCFLVILYNLL